MPTPQHHLSNALAGLIQTTSDKIALAAAAAAGTAPVWKTHVSELSAEYGPVFAVIFVASKIVLTWVQIYKAAQGGPPPR